MARGNNKGSMKAGASTTDSSFTQDVAASSASNRSLPVSLTSLLGPAMSVTMLLSDYAKYSLSERVSYHFHLTEALANSVNEIASSTDETEESQSLSSSTSPSKSSKSHRNRETNKPHPIHTCGFQLLLECIPAKPQLTRVERRALKLAIQRANQTAQRVRQTSRLSYEPSVDQWPLRLNPSTRVFFAYQKTRIVLLVDASPTMTATFGFQKQQQHQHQQHSTPSSCCPLDLVPSMARTYLSSLVKAIPLQFKDSWQPQISISVMAVFPKRRNAYLRDETQTSLLVRDYNLANVAAVEDLIQHLETWLYATVEEEIASRFGRHNPGFLHNDWSLGIVQQQQSSLREWLEAGDTALSTLSSEARPMLVVATDCRSVTCESVVSIMTSQDRVDQNFSILHVGAATATTSPSKKPPPSSEPQAVPTIAEVLMSDEGGGYYPLHLSNDVEALFGICNAMRGCFWDSKLLEEASLACAGKVLEGSSFAADHFFANRRHSIHPNAIQWYTLFSLSPLTPTPSPTFGKLRAPDFILQKRKYLQQQQQQQPFDTTKSSLMGPNTEQRNLEGLSIKSVASSVSGAGYRVEPGIPMSMRRYQNRTTFSMYVINPIRIQNLLQMRIREGYRANRYGARTNDPDRVDILFILSLDLDILLQYELSYKALPQHNHMVGSAQIKIYLSGEANFIQKVKQDFVQPAEIKIKERPSTLAQQVSDRLCRMLRWIRREDMLQSYIAPLRWNDQILLKDSPFIKRLGTLTTQQRWRHFRSDQFDCVCLGNMPYNSQTAAFLNAFHETDTGEKSLRQAFAAWSSQLVRIDKKGNNNQVSFLKKMKSTPGGLAVYCLVELVQSPAYSRIFTVSVETFGRSGVGDRLSLLATLQNMVEGLKDVRVLEKQISPYLVAIRSAGQASLPEVDRDRRSLLEHQTLEAKWDLMDDQELIPLLMRRRVEIDDFYLLESNANYALLAKIAQGHDSSDPGDLIQYQMEKTSDRVIVTLHMESEGGVVFPLGYKRQRHTHNTRRKSGTSFTELASTLGTTDKECMLALRARTNLLASLKSWNAEVNLLEKQSASLHTILPYTSRVSLSLRFFHEWSSMGNESLKLLVQDFLLSMQDVPHIARLSLETGEKINGFDVGDWFVVKYDPETMSLLHMADTTTNSEVSENSGQSACYRRLTFCTFSISDLYFSRQDRDENYVEEYMAQVQLSEGIFSTHLDLYASAAFIALQEDSRQLLSREVHMDDFLQTMKRLDWIEACQVVIARGSPKLVDVIKSLLRPVTGEDFYFFYAPQDGYNIEQESEKDSSLSEEDFSFEPEDSESSVDAMEELVQTVGQKEEASCSPQLFRGISTPLFFLFLVDGEPVSAYDLCKIENSSNLSAMISVYKEQNRQSGTSLPESHRRASALLSKRLNAYVAEQNLERLRIQSVTISEADLQLAKICLRKTTTVLAKNVELCFFNPEVGSIETAARDSLKEVVIFERELENSALYLKSDGWGSFVVVGVEELFTGQLPFWCFVSIRSSRGIVSVKIHHPLGQQQAAQILSKVCEEIKNICHRVNQLLILLHMHRSRTASNLMVPEDTDEPEKQNSASFECPIQFRFRFDLFHRCSRNSVQVARALESSVLHMFALSNRSHLFVYKDESGSIFYMSLCPQEQSQEKEGSLELHVRGVEKPGVSVTLQLTRLLSKRLMQIGLDMLSVVLTKNPHFNWKDADVIFVRSYSEKYLEVEDAKEAAPVKFKAERVYSFSEEVFDIGVVLLYFRQNLCGSTFFHPLVTNAHSGEENSISEQNAGDALGESLSSLSFFFNNSPSKLNASLQSQSTLTSKGEEYRRLAGTGLAIINMALLGSNGETLQSFRVGQEPSDNWTLKSIPRSTETSDDQDSNLSTFRLHVTICGTSLDINVLHEWVKLTLDQVLAAWAIERHLECRLRYGALPKATPGDVRGVEIDDLQPGLPTLISFLDECIPMPHPAVNQIESTGILRGSSLALIAMTLLERMLELINGMLADAQKILVDKHVCIVRIAKDHPPTMVRLEWSSKKVLVRRVGDGRGSKEDSDILEDKPIQGAEYLVFCTLPEKQEGQETRKSPSPKLFPAVAVDKKHLSEKQRHEGAFHRSFAFIFSIKRTIRLLRTYNWDRSLSESVSRRLTEQDASFLELNNKSNDWLQRRALNMLSPTMMKPVGKKRPASGKNATNPIETQDQTRPPSRLSRPIRQPKLIGKSVEGAASRALAASRARASFKGTYGAPSKPKPSAPRMGRNQPPRRADAPENKLSKEEAKLTRAKDEVLSKTVSTTRMTRRHTLLHNTFSALLESLGPLETHGIKEQTSEFILEHLALAWNVSIDFELLAPSMLAPLTVNIGETLAARSKGFNCIASPNSPDTDETTAPVFLIRAFKKARYARCSTIIRLQMILGTNNQHSLHCSAFNIKLPRRSKRRSNVAHHRYFSERDAAGADKLVVDTFLQTDIEHLLFDFMASIGGSLRNSEIPDGVNLLCSLARTYPLPKQFLMSSSQLKVFEAELILASYGNDLIDLFSAGDLFKWLQSMKKKRGMTESGKFALVCYRDIVVKGTQSSAILRYNPGDERSLSLLILCRTNGKDIGEFMFRGHSNVALTVAKAIAVEGAGMIFDELAAAATSLRRTNLWNKASDLHPSDKPRDEELVQLLELCSLSPILQTTGNERLQSLLETIHEDLPDCCDSMLEEPAFQPSFKLNGGNQAQTHWIFFLHQEQLFLVAQADSVARTQIAFSIMSQDSGDITELSCSLVVQKIANYLLHTIWKTLLSP